MNVVLTRRKLLKNVGVALAAIPIVVVSRFASAATNAAIRTQLKYQAKPENGNSCASCLEFIPGKTEHDLGGCKVIPDDDEISPDGYCTAWNTM